ncbi:hypothetical protein MMC15_006776 [Xylographa vitiligo]|nr:hypothetical protein [Xylographa vitiligo]
MPRGTNAATATPSPTGQPSSRSSLTLELPVTFQGRGQEFVRFSKIACVEEEADAMFSRAVGEMFTYVRGDGQLPEQFQETKLDNGGSVFRKASSGAYGAWASKMQSDTSIKIASTRR